MGTLSVRSWMMRRVHGAWLLFAVSTTFGIGVVRRANVSGTMRCQLNVEVLYHRVCQLHLELSGSVVWLLHAVQWLRPSFSLNGRYCMNGRAVFTMRRPTSSVLLADANNLFSLFMEDVPSREGVAVTSSSNKPSIVCCLRLLAITLPAVCCDSLSWC